MSVQDLLAAFIHIPCSHVKYVLSDVPDKPRGPLEISNVTENSADLKWRTPEFDGGSFVTSYKIESRPTSRHSWTEAATVDGGVTNVTVGDLRDGVEYVFRVTAVNVEGQGESLEGILTAKPSKKIRKYIMLTLFCFVHNYTIT